MIFSSKHSLIAGSLGPDGTKCLLKNAQSHSLLLQFAVNDILGPILCALLWQIVPVLILLCIKTIEQVLKTFVKWHVTTIFSISWDHRATVAFESRRVVLRTVSYIILFALMNLPQAKYEPPDLNSSPFLHFCVVSVISEIGMFQ